MTRRSGEIRFAKGQFLALVGCLSGLFGILFGGGMISLADQGMATSTPVVTPTPVGMFSIEDRLARPTLPPDPVQADLGGHVFYYVCMACHGDQGQGLTPDWIA